jgi:hypothetical protein
MSTAAAGDRLNRRRQGAVSRLPRDQTVFAAVALIDIENRDSGDRSGDDADVRLRPVLEPLRYLLRSGTALLEFLPPDKGSFPRWSDRYDRPAVAGIGQGGFSAGCFGHGLKGQK